MTYFLAFCDLCDMDVPFGTEELRTAWVEAHGATPHVLHDNQMPTITTREETRGTPKRFVRNL